MGSNNVRTVPDGERERAIAAQTMAFSADPITRWVWHDSQQYLTHFPEFVRVFGGDAFDHGTAFVAGDYHGIALWHPPGIHADDDKVGAMVEDSLFEADKEKVFAFFEEMGPYHPEGDIWYLPLIGVEPMWQGKGLGGALLKHALAKCDENGVPAYLEATSEGGRALYEHHGFEVTGTIQVADSPPMWPMLRPAR